ncbi:MAG: hypothetical protein ACUVQC_05500, partial [Thermaceae bacterium]
SFGPRVEVLEPPQLRTVWLEEARKLLETFSKDALEVMADG